MFSFPAEEVYDHLGVPANAIQGSENEGYAHLDFSDVRNGENVQLNSIYESREHAGYKKGSEIEATYGNLAICPAHTSCKDTVAPYVSYNPSEDAGEDSASNLPNSLDPSR